MSVNLEVKGSLAKCLATENLIVEHKNVPSASFDVDRRVLTLPNWKKASETVYDLLVGHEVGHALYTDNIDWTVDYPEVPKDFVNVVEDARIEKLMKRKFPGLSRSFYNGYQELNQDDFFSVKEENLDEMSLIDRINLYFKIGAFHNISFTDAEDEFVSRISKAETFEEVLEISQDLVNFVKDKKKQEDFIPVTSQQGQSGSSQSSHQNSENTSDETDEEGEGEGENTAENMEAPTGSSSQQPSDELKSKTSQSFDEKTKELNDERSQDTIYVELPEFDLSKLIIPNTYIHDKAKEYYNSFEHSKEWYQGELLNFKQYKKSAEKEVSYLVKEFECKKSADAYARTTTARTGILDTSQLHTYKYNEDLFKKVSVIPDGKNHGLIFILDWSGSMSNYILDTYKQLLNLMWFCKKVGIPFEVYAFTLDCNSYVELDPNHTPTYKKVAGVLAPEQSFRLMNFFTSTVSNKVLEEQMGHIWAVAKAFQSRHGYSPYHLDLSGSPIGDTLLALHKIIPDFQTKTKLQKVNVVFLTDGEGYQNCYTTEKKLHYLDELVIGYTRLGTNVCLRDRRTGRIYKNFQYNHFPSYAKIILQTLKDRFPMVNLINFRITAGRDFNLCCQWYADADMDRDKLREIYKKQRSVTFKQTGFDQFHVLASNSIAEDAEFEVEEGASKAQIRTAFTKMLGKKKTNKRVLNEFIGCIA